MKRYKDDTKPWKGSYAPYDLVKEAFIAVCAVAAFADPAEHPVLLTG